MEGGGEYKKLWDCGRLVIVGLVASCKRCRAGGEKWPKCKRECCGLVILDLEWSRRRCRRWLWCLLGGIVAAWSLVPCLVQEAASGEEWGKQAGGESTHWKCIFNLRIWHWEFFCFDLLVNPTTELLENVFWCVPNLLFSLDANLSNGLSFPKTLTAFAFFQCIGL